MAPETSAEPGVEAVEKFRLELRAAFLKTKATQHSSRWSWPEGQYIRVLIEPPADAKVKIPPIVDPIGALWLAKTGELRGPLESEHLASDLGLNPTEARKLLRASDKDWDSPWRTMLTEEVGRLPKYDPFPRERPDAERRWTILFGLFLAGVLGFAAVQVGWFRGGPFPAPGADFLRRSYAACQSFVLQRVDTPSTASFAGRFSGDTTVIEGTDDRIGEYRVSSWVDAENLAGAKVRNRFQCAVAWVAGADGRADWVLRDLKLEAWSTSSR